MTSGKGKKDNNFSFEDWVVKKIYVKEKNSGIKRAKQSKIRQKIYINCNVTTAPNKISNK